MKKSPESTAQSAGDRIALRDQLAFSSGVIAANPDGDGSAELIKVKVKVGTATKIFLRLRVTQ